MSPTTATVKLLISTALMLLALSFLGNALPGAVGRYIPPLAREEYVRIHAIQESPTPCVAIFGDSRVAFNISGAIIDKALPDKCRSQNYGFPGIGLEIIERLSRETAPKLAILSPTEPMLTQPLEPLTFMQVVEAEHRRLVRRIIQVPLLRTIYFGYSRVSLMLRPVPVPSDGWDWSSAQKRWLSSGIEKREFVSLPSYKSESADMAANYFMGNRAGLSEQLIDLIKSVRSRGASVAILIPPSEDSFQQQAKSSGQRDRWQIMHAVAGELDVPIIDCSNSRNCSIDKSGFADPVHLNDDGVKGYTTAITTASLNALDRLARTVWQGHAVGVIDDSGAQDLAEQIHRRRTDARSERKPVGLPPGAHPSFCRNGYSGRLIVPHPACAGAAFP